MNLVQHTSEARVNPLAYARALKLKRQRECAQAAAPSILDVMHDPQLLGPWFSDRETWRAWEAFLAALFGLPMTDEHLAVFTKHAGREVAPEDRAREAWVIVGRRGGKSRVAALIAVYLACFREYQQYLAPGEVGTFAIIAADKSQARSVMRYIAGFLEAVPALKSLIGDRTKETIEIAAKRVQIEVRTASFKTTRGYTLIGVICDEIAFWQTDDGSANPDLEILNALRPGMSSIPGALLLGMSSPYARRGVLWNAYQNHYGKDGNVLVWKADTRSMNPQIDQTVIDAAYEEDEATASAEYGGEFRRDIESFVSPETIAACTIPGRTENPPARASYVAFVDPSGGSQDSMTLAIAHRQGNVRTLDCIRERKAPFSPAEVVREFADVLKVYKVTTVVGDRYAGEWPREKFREHGIVYRVAEKTRSDLYRDLLPLLTARTAELLDDPTLKRQLCRLERRTSRAGKDSIDHPPGSHDDVANAVAGALSIVGAGIPAGGVGGGTQNSYWRGAN